MRRKSLEITSNQVKNGLEWGDSMSGAPRAVEKETSRQRRSCARWVFPQPAKAIRLIEWLGWQRRSDKPVTKYASVDLFRMEIPRCLA